MKLTILGCGTSGGVPELGCDCPVCTSNDPKNNRTRSSILVSSETTNIIVDTSPEFRGQALACGLSDLKAVLFTHHHADHLHGLDDIRPFTRKAPISIYANEDTIREIKRKFSYFFNPPQQGGGVPQVVLTTLLPFQEILIGDITVIPIPVKHGNLDILGYRIGKLAYITDCSYISEQSFDALLGIDTLVIGALRYKPHSTHFNVIQALEVIKKLQVKQGWLTHMTHDLDYYLLDKDLPDNINPAFDNLNFSF